MTYEQAIDEFKQRLEIAKDWDGADLEYCEALKLGIKAMEKLSVGKEVTEVQTSKYGFQYACPVCRSLLLTSYFNEHCKYCGQKLKWSDEE
jgi:rRNA maturation endonuclease Nob1